MKFNIKDHPSYVYAQEVVQGKRVSNKYIKIVCQRFIDEIEDNSKIDYFFDVKSLEKISKLLKMLNMAEGTKQGEPVYDCLVGFQWFFLVNIFCWRKKEDPTLRRYISATLLIGRKEGKTFLSAIVFILLMLLEPRFSNFYSVAPDLDLSTVLKTQVDKLLDSSPIIGKHFKHNQKITKCTLTQNVYQPLAFSKNRMDARAATAFLSDETGALPNRGPISAMESSQLQVKNKLGIIISTAYDSLHNPMTEEVEKAQLKIVDGEQYDPTYFALLYKPDKPLEWSTSDDEVYKANPILVDLPWVHDYVFHLRENAIQFPPERPNFLTKFMNIFVDGDAGESYVTEEDVTKAELTQPFDWKGRDVYLGLDLAMSRDNFGISMVTYDAGHDVYVAKSWALYALGRELEKSKAEGINYAHMTAQGYSFATGDDTSTIIDYGFVDDFLMSLESTYGVHIKGIGYDKWNAGSTVAKLKQHGYDTLEISQGKATYPGTKKLRELIKDERFFFDKNELLKINFLNAIMVTDMNFIYFLNKKKSNGKIDMVASLIDAFNFIEKQEIYDIEHGPGQIFII